jgi:hypothetical protein
MTNFDTVRAFIESVHTGEWTGPINREEALSELERMAGEPYGTVTVVRNPGRPVMHWFYRWPEPPYLDNAAECHTVYAAPPAQQPQYEAGDMASAAAQGFRDGVASVAQQPQAEPLTDEQRLGWFAWRVKDLEQKLTQALKQPQAEAVPCGGRDYCGRFPFCGCGDSDPLPERDTTKPAEQQGLFRKFVVRRTDGSDEPGGKHDGCEYFVLDVTHDKHARAALAAYAASVEETHQQLAADMRVRYQLAPPQQAEAVPCDVRANFEKARADGAFSPALDCCPTWYATDLRFEGWSAAIAAQGEKP